MLNASSSPETPPQRERIDLTAEQLAAIRSTTPWLKEQAVKELLGDPDISKATISRIRNGQDFYHKQYHAREQRPNVTTADRLEEEIAESAAYVAERIMLILEDHPDVEDTLARRAGSLEELEESLADIAEAHLVNLAGNPGIERKSWRTLTAYHALMHLVRQAIAESLQPE